MAGLPGDHETIFKEGNNEIPGHLLQEVQEKGVLSEYPPVTQAGANSMKLPRMTRNVKSSEVKGLARQYLTLASGSARPTLAIAVGGSFFPVSSYPVIIQGLSDENLHP